MPLQDTNKTKLGAVVWQDANIRQKKINLQVIYMEMGDTDKWKLAGLLNGNTTVRCSVSAQYGDIEGSLTPRITG